LAGLVETTVDEFNAGLLRLNRPEARNALSAEMRERLLGELRRLDADPAVRCLVLAGSDKVFAAGADIRAMAERPLDAAPDPAGMDFWRGIAAVETPLIAAVSGFALGGGCELALSCDMIVADEKARFGQPEVTLGIIPGGGGTQRLTRAIGKQRAMEYVLTGRLFEAKTAHQWGLVNLVVGKGLWLTEAIELARTVASRAPLATRLAKQAVLAAEETALAEGLARERELFERAMTTEDRVEGMNAFLEKREPDFQGR
jgi:enoyl-CoA hydratase/carnithine racemase